MASTRAFPSSEVTPPVVERSAWHPFLELVALLDRAAAGGQGMQELKSSEVLAWLRRELAWAEKEVQTVGAQDRLAGALGGLLLHVLLLLVAADRDLGTRARVPAVCAIACAALKQRLSGAAVAIDHLGDAFVECQVAPCSAYLLLEDPLPKLPAGPQPIWRRRRRDEGLTDSLQRRPEASYKDACAGAGGVFSNAQRGAAGPIGASDACALGESLSGAGSGRRRRPSPAATPRVQAPPAAGVSSCPIAGRPRHTIQTPFATDDEDAAQRDFLAAASCLSEAELRQFVHDHVKEELASIGALPAAYRPQAFRSLLLDWHPDKCPAIRTLATEVFQQLQSQKAQVLHRR